MFKKGAFFISIIAIALSACSSSDALQIIDEERANELFKLIHEEFNQYDGPFEYTFKSTHLFDKKTTDKDETEDVSYIKSKDGEFYYSWISKTGNNINHKGVTIFKKDSKYEEIYYQDIVHNEEYISDKHNNYAIQKKNNPIFDNQRNQYISNEAEQDIHNKMYVLQRGSDFTPASIEKTTEKYREEGYGVESKYEADQNGNMRVTVTTTLLETTPIDSADCLKKSKEVIVFKNYRFKEYKATSDQVNGESFTYESSMKYFSRIISLPKGWKSVLVEPGTYTFPRAKLDAFLLENNIHVTVPTLSIEGTVYDCQTDNNSSSLNIRYYVDNVSTTFGVLKTLIPESWEINPTDGNYFYGRVENELGIYAHTYSLYFDISFYPLNE